VEFAAATRRRRILANLWFAGLTILSFAQTHDGTISATPAASKGVPPGFELRSGAGNAATRRAGAFMDVRDVSGVDCTGVADSAPALNALTGNAPASNNAITGRTLSFGGCGSIKLRNTWLIKNQAGFIIDGFTRSGAAGKGVHITWAGSALGVMIDMEYVDGFQVRGLFVDGSNAGGVGIVVDKKSSGGIWNTTDGRFVNNSYSGSATKWIGISISPVSGENVEDMRIEDSTFSCNAPKSTTAAVGVMIGASANAKNEILTHNNITGCYYGVWKKGGSAQIRDGEFENNGGTCGSGTGADIRDDGNSDVDIIEGNLEEGGTQGINENNDRNTGGYNHPVIVRGNHNAPAGCENRGRYWYNTAAGVSWLFDGDSWDADSDLVKVIGTNNAGTIGPVIYTRGMLYPNNIFAPWWTNGTTTISDDLKIMDDKLMVYGAASDSFPAAGNNFPSPFLVYRGYLNGSTSNPDDITLQNIPASGGGSSGGTFLIKHQQGATGTEFLSWDGAYPGINIAKIPMPSISGFSQGGTSGSTSYTYAVVAFGPVGSTAGSAASVDRRGNAALTSANYNQIQWYPVAGATKYCIWRTASGGTPSSTGNIGCTSALQLKGQSYRQVMGYSVNMGSVTNTYKFKDTGLPGDFAALPTSNTTGTLSLPGQITSTLVTGTAPLSISSTTPVSNLTLKNHPQVYEAGVLAASGKIYTNTQHLTGGAATHSFANSFTFSSSRTFGCICTDQTAANACSAVPASASTVTLAGTASDVLWIECAGH
jgi:hypothetical protein